MTTTQPARRDQTRHPAPGTRTTPALAPCRGSRPRPQAVIGRTRGEAVGSSSSVAFAGQGAGSHWLVEEQSCGLRGPAAARASREPRRGRLGRHYRCHAGYPSWPRNATCWHCADERVESRLPWSGSMTTSVLLVRIVRVRGTTCTTWGPPFSTRPVTTMAGRRDPASLPAGIPGRARPRHPASASSQAVSSSVRPCARSRAIVSWRSARIALRTVSLIVLWRSAARRVMRILVVSARHLRYAVWTVPSTRNVPT